MVCLGALGGKFVTLDGEHSMITAAGAAAATGCPVFTALATCPTGWGYDPAQGHRVARLALETGIWPLKEAVQGQVRHTYVPDRRQPVEEYLRTQHRFGHLFAPRRQEEALARIQQDVDAYWGEVDPLEPRRPTPT